MSTATATAPPRREPAAAGATRTRTAPLDPATVIYDSDRSTKFHAVYRAPSVSAPGSYRHITMDQTTGEWLCSCPATVTECRHIRAARQARRLIWWRNAYQGLDAPTLREQDRAYAAMCAEGTLDEDGMAGWSVVGDELQSRWLAAQEEGDTDG